MRDPLSKLICMGCLKETPVNGVIDGNKYRKQCVVCREQKNHVARPHDFKVAGFTNRPCKAEQAERVLGLSFLSDTETVAVPTARHMNQ